MTWIALRAVLSAISGTITLDLIKPSCFIIIILIILTLTAGLFEKKFLYLTIFFLSGLNFKLARPSYIPYYWIEGTGTIIDTRPFYGNYLITVRSKNGIFEMQCKENIKECRIYFTGFVKKNRLTKIVVEPVTIRNIGPSRNFLVKIFTFLRNNIISTSHAITKNEDNRGLLISLLLGRNYYPRKELHNFFTRSGIVHILTVSGLHVGFIFGLGFIICSTIGLKRLNAYLFALLLIPIYAGITGFRIPVIRASIMLGLVGITQFVDRKVPMIHFLIIALLLMLLFDPNIIFNPGAQLSFAATAGIILLYKEFSYLLPKKRNLFRPLLSLLLISVSAQLATAPILIYYFHRIPTFATITNILVVPMAWLAVAVGLFTVILHHIFSPLASILAASLNLILTVILMLAKYVAQSSISSINVTWIPTIIIIPFYLSFIKKIRKYGLIAFLVISNLFLFLPKSYRLEISSSKLRINPTGIELSQMINLKNSPVDIKINDLKITPLREELNVIYGNTNAKISTNGVYHITKTNIIKQRGGNIILEIHDELKLLLSRTISIFN